MMILSVSLSPLAVTGSYADEFYLRTIRDNTIPAGFCKPVTLGEITLSGKIQSLVIMPVVEILKMKEISRKQ